jgi:hypothetical protein
MTHSRHVAVLVAALGVVLCFSPAAVRADGDEQKEAKAEYDAQVAAVQKQLADAKAAGKDTKSEEALLAQAAALYQKKDYVNARRHQKNLAYLLERGEEELTQSFKERGDRIGALYKELMEKLDDKEDLAAMWKEAEADIKAGNYEEALEKLDALEAELMLQKTRIEEGDKPQKDEKENCVYKSSLLKFQIEKPAWTHWIFEVAKDDGKSTGGVSVKCAKEEAWVDLRAYPRVKNSFKTVAEEWVERAKLAFENPKVTALKKTKFAGTTAYEAEFTGKSRSPELKDVGVIWYKSILFQKGDFTYSLGIVSSESHKKSNKRNLDFIQKSFKFVK